MVIALRRPELQISSMMVVCPRSLCEATVLAGSACGKDYGSGATAKRKEDKVVGKAT